MQLADMAEVHNRLGGVEGAIAMATKHSGKLLAQGVVRAFCVSAPDILADLDEPWDRVIAAEPLPLPPLSGTELDSVLEVLADIADLKSPWLSGHSRGVAQLAARAAAASGMPAHDVTTVRHTGLVHDIGRTAIANNVWDKPGPLTDGERERARLHPSTPSACCDVLRSSPVSQPSRRRITSGSTDPDTTAACAAPTSRCWAGISPRRTCSMRCGRSVHIVLR
jgi:HD-GYP domain-containing protein (c-di-GMP phosphodiesterase class II)